MNTRVTNKTVVSKSEKILFPIVGFLICGIIAPGSVVLIGMLLFGNLMKECGVTDRLSNTAKSAFIDIVTILLGVSVGASASAEMFLTPRSLKIFALGLVATWRRPLSRPSISSERAVLRTNPALSFVPPMRAPSCGLPGRRRFEDLRQQSWAPSRRSST